jgi:hypothetical protein
VLGQFARSNGSAVPNRLVVTTNLGAGQLVPKLLHEVRPLSDPMAPVVDLFHAGVPTRAMVAWQPDYEALWQRLRADVLGATTTDGH